MPLSELACNWFSRSPLLAGGAALGATLSNLDSSSIAAPSIGVVINTAIAIYSAGKLLSERSIC